MDQDQRLIEQMDWADLLAWRFIGGLSGDLRDIERWRETRVIVAAEFRKAKADGLREAAKAADNTAAKIIDFRKSNSMPNGTRYSDACHDMARCCRALADIVEKAGKP